MALMVVFVAYFPHKNIHLPLLMVITGNQAKILAYAFFYREYNGASPSTLL